MPNPNSSEQGYTFSGHDASRIKRAVHAYEKDLMRKGNYNKHSALPPDTDQYGYINSKSGPLGKYDWTVVHWTPYGWEPDTSYGGGSYAGGTYAQEFFGGDDVLEGEVVPLKWTENGYYIFVYDPPVYWAKLVSAGSIGGRTGNTPGSGDVTIQWFNPETGDLADWQDVPVKNGYRKTIEGESGGTLYLKVNWSQGHWWVDNVDCLTEDEPAP